MKGDFTRNTFKSQQHFSSVRMQQGRVQLDADWNEQADIFKHRVERETVDAIGGCGAPIHDAAFEIVLDPTKLSAEEQARLTSLGVLPLQTGDFLLTNGRYYVDGILVENEHTISFAAQPDLAEPQPPSSAGSYLIYLDVWQRHLTTLEAPPIREVALGGPDTATRTRTVWQVKRMTVAGGTNCLSDLTAWDNLLEGSTGKLTARAEPETTSTDPCIVPASAGFRGLQNQLYRVEIHQGGGLGGGKAAPTYKWSRDNGSVVFAVDEFLDTSPTKRLRMRSLGKDSELALHKGDWVEVLGDDHELTFTPGTIVQIDDIDTDDLVITLSAAVDEIDLERHPKVRRWDSVGAETVQIPGTNDGFLPLEDGVEVKFSTGSYHTGDYWLIPARTILGNPVLTQTGGIEWPLDDADDPLPQPPEGIRHHYCRLAVLAFDGVAFTDVQDCRPLFPPATELVELFYLGGDGQEAMPGQVLAQPLRAGVSNGRWPVKGARVCFSVKAGNGVLTGGGSSGAEIPVETDDFGVASVTWDLDNTTQIQVVEATLEDAAGDPQHLPIRYTANLSVASQVAYDAECKGLEKANTVQDALDELCKNAWLRYVGGDGQSGRGDTPLAFPLEVRLANGQWPVAKETVVFQIVPPGDGQLTGGGQVGKQVKVDTDEEGYASCTWEIDGKNNAQQVVAFWEGKPEHFIHFNAFIEARGRVPRDDPAIHILDVLIGGKPLELNSLHSVGELKEGIFIVLESPVTQSSLDELACTVTLDKPYPLNDLDIEMFDKELIGFEPLRLLGKLSPEGNGEIIRWDMAPQVENFLFRLLSRMIQLGYGEVVAVHLTLKGNFFYDDKDPQLHVDADAFATFPGSTPTGLTLPSGDGKRGGLFETWFRILEG